MMTSWNKTEQIELFILKKLKPEDSLVFQARLLVDEKLREDLSAQEAAYAIIENFGRKNLREEIFRVQNEVLNKSHHWKLLEIVTRIFKK